MAMVAQPVPLRLHLGVWGASGLPRYHRRVAPTPRRPPSESVLDRFLRYVRINTESREGTGQSPSTPGQWDLARLLTRELQALGVRDIHTSDACIVYARNPSNLQTDC